MRMMETGTVVIGTGPGGATVARELAKKEKRVVLLEKGKARDWSVGNPLAYAAMYDIRRSRQGILVRRGITPGGSTMIYSGNAYDPPSFLKDDFGIDLAAEVSEVKEELNIRPVPDHFYQNYPGTRRLVEAAGELGHAMKPQARFIDSALCDPHCDKCLFGCKRGAKWTARSYVNDAVDEGARLVTGCDVREILHVNGMVNGVSAQTDDGPLTVFCHRVVLAAGGMGTPEILHWSGIKGAGTHFFTDPMAVLLGEMKEGSGTFREITYTFADESRKGEFVFGNVGAVNAFVAQVAAKNFSALPRGARMKKLTGMFVKLCDEPTGEIRADGSFHKAFTPKDEALMAQGIEAAKAVMVRAGVRPGTIAVAKGIGGHPGGTAAMGRVVGTDLQTDIENLYICDNSIMPVSGGTPPVLTLIALARQFAGKLA
ncbi:FAD-dependent oxidoreductase [Desulfoluna spongiiphila]|uniref:GMC oxidoreductase n=1 Tax=Desulfoluna spongiiphila TaxID=419481 RepID=A0A1G5BI72_9BACT|nr:FAD-dependent oxidoreductase [Desulfoluna spongiiphila]SCX89883.1 GMC oxidoreductase [Desulfoluna spongiiphila]